jgi:hypothetical protein
VSVTKVAATLTGSPVAGKTAASRNGQTVPKSALPKEKIAYIPRIFFHITEHLTKQCRYVSKSPYLYNFGGNFFPKRPSPEILSILLWNTDLPT